MANTKHEDAIMKMGIDYFREALLKVFGLEFTFTDSAPTELVELTIHSLYMDFTFLTDKDMYIHFEFQTTDGGDEDLRRFRAYEAVLANRTGKSVITYVIYSGGIKNVKSSLKCGISTYSVVPVYFADRDADEVFRELEKKRSSGEIFTEEDFARLSLTPLMAGSLSRKETIKKAVRLVKSDRHRTAQKAMSILYTLADKFAMKVQEASRYGVADWVTFLYACGA